MPNLTVSENRSSSIEAVETLLTEETVPFEPTVADWILCWTVTDHQNGCPLCGRRYSAERVSKERTITLGKALY